MDIEMLKRWEDLWTRFPNELASLDRLEEKLGHRFANRLLLYEALCHRSAIAHFFTTYRPDDATLNVRNFLPWNERIEFLGDSVLGLFVSHELWSKNSELQEGALSKIRSSLVNEARLAEVAESIGLGESILLGKGEIKAGGRNRKALLADALEAVIGAVYLDGGFEEARLVIGRLFAKWFSDLKGVENTDYKSKLQEWTQDLFQKLPTYELRKQTGPEHAREFEVWVYFNGEFLASGIGKTKKQASQAAAQKALQNLKKKAVIPNSDEDMAND